MTSGLLLSLCTLLLFFRISGQILVVLRAPRWLPPMEQWQSGLLPYPILLCGQAVVFTLMVWISANAVRGSGVFVDPRRPAAGLVIVGLSGIYFGWMIVRYIVRMLRRPDQRWFGGTIPIVFHCVVALFLFTFGRYHAGRL
jgi:uncharacterized protein